MLLSSALFFARCGGDDKVATTAPENDVDAARTFIRSALDGRWKDARRLIVQDSANIQDLEVAEQAYTQRLSASDQREYRESQIRIYDTRKVSDSISVVIYSNTVPKYINRRDSLQVIKMNGVWLVNLKYSFPNNNRQR